MAEILSALSATGTEGTTANGGARYTSISDWENAQQGNLTGIDNPAGEPSTSVLECYEGAYGGIDGGLDDLVDITSWTTDSSHYITIKAAAGNEHDPITKTGFFMTCSATAQVTLIVRVNYTRIYSIGVYPTNRAALNLNGGTDCILHGCTIVGDAAGGTGAGAATFARYCIPLEFYNNLVINRDTGTESRGISIDRRNTAAGRIANNTIISYGYAFYITEISADNQNYDLINNVFYSISGTAWDYAFHPYTGDVLTNATTDAALTGTGQTDIDSTDFEDYAGGDYTPATGGKLDGTGTNLYATFTDDITGFTRPDTGPWEIGAYAIQGGVVPTPPTDVEAGGAYSGTVGTPIAIDGASYTPGTGSPDVILWTFIGPGGSFDDDSILSPTFTPDGVDTYALTLTVTNDAGSAADTASLTSGAVPVEWNGPDIVAQTGAEDVLFSFDEDGSGTVASRFTGATSYALAPTSDALPTGLTVNSTTGNIEGTPTVNGEFANIIIEGSD